MRPQALDALRGSDLIIHAGDVGDPKILDALKAIAPTIAVKGNVDANFPDLPDSALIAAGPALIYVIHDVKELDFDAAASRVHIVVSGHSHRCSQAERKGVLYVNPGSAGPRRFRLPIGIAKIDLTKSPWSAEFIRLDT
jgi:uncharacterized protein